MQETKQNRFSISRPVFYGTVMIIGSTNILGLITNVRDQRTFPMINNIILIALLAATTIFVARKSISPKLGFGVGLMALWYIFITEIIISWNDPSLLSLKIYVSTTMASAFIVLYGFTVNRIGALFLVGLTVAISTSAAIHNSNLYLLQQMPYFIAGLLALGAIIFVYKGKIEQLVNRLEKSQETIERERRQLEKMQARLDDSGIA
jgi:hypothetical protein